MHCSILLKSTDLGFDWDDDGACLWVSLSTTLLLQVAIAIWSVSYLSNWTGVCCTSLSIEEICLSGWGGDNRRVNFPKQLMAKVKQRTLLPSILSVSSTCHLFDMLGHDDLKDSFWIFLWIYMAIKSSCLLPFKPPSLCVLKFHSFTYCRDIKPDAYSTGEL